MTIINHFIEHEKNNMMELEIKKLISEKWNGIEILMKSIYGNE